MKREPDDCTWTLERVDAMVASELEADEETALARHVLDCAACAAELGAAERVEAELRALPAFDAPPALVRKLRAIPTREAASASGRRRYAVAWPVALAATLTVAVAVGWWVQREPRSAERHAVAEPRPSQAELERATADARLALAVVARLGRKARDEVRDEVVIQRVAAPVLESLGFGAPPNGPPPTRGARS